MKYCNDCKQETEVEGGKYKDVIGVNTKKYGVTYITVYVYTCAECGFVHEDDSFLE